MKKGMTLKQLANRIVETVQLLPTVEEIVENILCSCTFIGDSGFIHTECKYHETHCHFLKCKKKTLKGQRYCKEHKKYIENDKSGIDAYGGSDF